MTQKQLNKIEKLTNIRRINIEKTKKLENKLESELDDRRKISD